MCRQDAESRGGGGGVGGGTSGEIMTLDHNNSTLTISH